MTRNYRRLGGIPKGAFLARAGLRKVFDICGKFSYSSGKIWFPHKEDNGEFLKCKVSLYAREDQLISGVSFKESDLYAPVLKTTQARLLLALAAAEGAKVIITDPKQAYLYGDMGDGVVYI